MKKLMKTALVAGVLLGAWAPEIQAQSLKDILNSKTVQNAVTAVTGGQKMSMDNLVGTWTYSQPSVQLEGDNVLKDITGSVAATEAEKKLQEYCSKVGIEEGLFNYTFQADSTFTSQLKKGSLKGTYTFDVPLIKNTNNVRVVLQHLSGEPVDKDKFTFTIYDENGMMDWDNSLLPDEPITYYAWHTDSGEAGIESSILNQGISTRSVFSAAIAELTVARLVKGQNSRLAVSNNETGEVVFSIPLIDYALLVKGFYNRDMDDQEYLDREDTYDMVFFLDEGDRWVDTHIYINSWKVVLQDTDL